MLVQTSLAGAGPSQERAGTQRGDGGWRARARRGRGRGGMGEFVGGNSDRSGQSDMEGVRKGGRKEGRRGEEGRGKGARLRFFVRCDNLTSANGGTAARRADGRGRTGAGGRGMSSCSRAWQARWQAGWLAARLVAVRTSSLPGERHKRAKSAFIPLCDGHTQRHTR